MEKSKLECQYWDDGGIYWNKVTDFEAEIADFKTKLSDIWTTSRPIWQAVKNILASNDVIEQKVIALQN